MKKSTVVASLGVVVFVLLIAWSIVKIAGSPAQTGSVGLTTRGNAPAFIAQYVVCEEADKYGVEDPGTAAGTVVIVSDRDLRGLRNLTFQPNGGNGRTGDILMGTLSIGGYSVFGDRAYAGDDPIDIEPGQTKIGVSNGHLLSYYCDTTLSGLSSSPLVVSSGPIKTSSLSNSIDRSVKTAFPPIPTFSSQPWTITIYRHTFTGTAHKTP